MIRKELVLASGSYGGVSTRRSRLEMGDSLNTYTTDIYPVYRYSDTGGQFSNLEWARRAGCSAYQLKEHDGQQPVLGEMLLR